MRASIRCLLLACLAAAGMWAADADPAAEVAARLGRLAPTQIAERVELARWARAHGQAAQSTAILEAVIAAQPDHAVARQLLGYERVGGAWLRGDALYTAKKWVRYLGRWMPPAEQRKLVARRAALRQQVKGRAMWKDAWEAKTEHFVVRSNAPVRVVEDIMSAMERYYAVASRMFQLTGSQARIPVEVYADQAEFMRASAEDGMGASGNVLGYFSPGRDLIRCYYAGSVDQTLGTLFHETTHLIVHRFARRDVPTWTNEGLAVYFEDAERLEDRIDVDAVPWSRLWHLRDMQAAGPIDLADTVRCPHRGYNVTYYPRGWSLVHFLLHGAEGRYRKGFEAYLMALRKGGDAPAAELFKATIGVEPSALQAEWAAHIARLEPAAPDELAAAAMASIGLSLDVGRAEGYATRAVAAAPRDWRAHAALGRVLLARARLDADAVRAGLAVESLDQAVALAQATPAAIKARIRKGQSLMVWTSLLEDRIFALIAAGDAERALAAIGELLEVDEANAHAYGALAVIGAADREGLAEAREWIATARDLGYDHVVRWCAARVAAAGGDRAEAQRLLGEAAALDGLGLGRRWYRREASRLVPGSAANLGDDS